MDAKKALAALFVQPHTAGVHFGVKRNTGWKPRSQSTYKFKNRRNRCSYACVLTLTARDFF